MFMLEVQFLKVKPFLSIYALVHSIVNKQLLPADMLYTSKVISLNAYWPHPGCMANDLIHLSINSYGLKWSLTIVYHICMCC